MNISPANISIPVMAPSVNPSTEQVATDNRLREQVIPPRKLNATEAESAVTQQERRFRQSSWDPAEHPSYSKKQFAKKNNEHNSSNKNAFSNDTYNQEALKINYKVNVTPPQEVMDKIDELKDSSSTANVVAVRYQQSASENTPSDIVIVI